MTLRKVLIALTVAGAALAVVSPMVGLVLYARGGDLFFGLTMYGFLLAFVSAMTAFNMEEM